MALPETDRRLRRLRTAAQTQRQAGSSRNRISFSSGEPDPTAPESSATSPLRRFTWTDHECNTGDKVSYQVVPVIEPPDGGDAVANEAQASKFSTELELSGEVDNTFECYFNRGLVISQFMSRRLKGDFQHQIPKSFQTGAE